MPGILLTKRGELSSGCGTGGFEEPGERTRDGASGMGVSSDFMGVAVAVETRLKGVGVETAEGSFFLWERVPFEVRPGPAGRGVETAGVVGVGAAGRGVGPRAW